MGVKMLDVILTRRADKLTRGWELYVGWWCVNEWGTWWRYMVGWTSGKGLREKREEEDQRKAEDRCDEVKETRWSNWQQSQIEYLLSLLKSKATLFLCQSNTVEKIQNKCWKQCLNRYIFNRQLTNLFFCLHLTILINIILCTCLKNPNLTSDVGKETTQM